jgi:O-antigen/teichoic acid export membrane protein
MLFSFGQAVISALCVFLTFRLVIAGTSLSEFGVVSVLLAIGAASKIGDVSGATALSRLLPVEIKEGREGNATTLIKTVITTNITIFTVVAGVLLLFADSFLPLIFENQDLDIAQSLLPFLVLQIIFSSLSAALASGIDGVHRADIRALLVSAGYMTLPISSLLFIPWIGVSGYVMALIVQHVLVTLIGWMLLRNFVNGMGLSPFGWEKATFKRTIGYVLRLNVMTLFAFSFEPIAKISIQIAAGSSAVGLYEVASRAVFQVRNLVVSASTPTIPKLASYKASETDQIVLMVKQLVPLYSLAAVALAIVLAALTPIVSYLVFSQINSSFIIVMQVLAIGWSMSVIVLPMYFLAQAQGILRWNIIGHTTCVARSN